MKNSNLLSEEITWEEGQELINAGADINARTEDGQTPLMVHCDDPDWVRLLLEAGADVNARDEDGCIALHYCENPDAAQLMIEHGANVNACGNQYNTPIMNIKQSEYIDDETKARLIHLIAEHGGMDSHGELAWNWSHDGKNKHRFELCRTLIENGISLECLNLELRGNNGMKKAQFGDGRHFGQYTDDEIDSLLLEQFKSDEKIYHLLIENGAKTIQNPVMLLKNRKLSKLELALATVPIPLTMPTMKVDVNRSQYMIRDMGMQLAMQGYNGNDVQTLLSQNVTEVVTGTAILPSDKDKEEKIASNAMNISEILTERILEWYIFAVRPIIPSNDFLEILVHLGYTLEDFQAVYYRSADEKAPRKPSNPNHDINTEPKEIERILQWYKNNH